MILLDDLPPAQHQAWEVLFRLPQQRLSWVLIGGQMMALLAAEHGARLPRPTLDADVLVDVRATPAPWRASRRGCGTSRASGSRSAAPTSATDSPDRPHPGPAR